MCRKLPGERGGACFGLSTNRERRIPLPLRWCARCVTANRSKPSSLSSSSPAIDALRRLEPQPAISARIPETVFLLSEPKPNRQFPDCCGLSPNSLESLLRLSPAQKHSRLHPQRPQLSCSSINLRPIGLACHLSTATEEIWRRGPWHSRRVLTIQRPSIPG